MRSLLVLLLFGGLLAAAPAWNVSGRWTGFVGDLQLTQAADGALTGTFQMKVGCTEAYNAIGRIGGSAVSLSLTRAAGAGDKPPCAGTQTLKGTVAAGGRSMSLALTNAGQSSPAAPFSGTAKAISGTTTTTAKPTTTAPATRTTTGGFPVSVDCHKSPTQLCPTAFTTIVRSAKGPLTMTFTAAKAHCSDVRLRFSLDGGGEQVSPFVHPGAKTPAYRFAVAAGAHTVKVRAEGRAGGCNYGELRGWGGTLVLTYSV